MDRRGFLQLSFSLAALASVSACEKSVQRHILPVPEIEVPPFSKSRVLSKLDALEAAYESKGIAVSRYLRTPVSDSELRKRCTWFPGEIVPELVTLYGWHDGQEVGADEPFWFRDTIFASLQTAEQEYDSMMSSYGQHRQYRELLRYAFPFAEFEGAFYVLPTRTHPFLRGLARPVISVFEGVEVYFYSLETLLDTCIDWVLSEHYNKNYSLPADVEREIWERHNPGIFDLRFR